MSTKFNRFKWETRPIAGNCNIVKGKDFRITVLTDALIRIEFDKDGIFEDRASQTVFYRDLPPVNFTCRVSSDETVVETEKLILRCGDGQSLSVKLKEEPCSVWNYGDDFEDLGGTTETLDATNGEVPLERGICSRFGYSVLDDTDSMLLDEIGWIVPRRKNTQDIYFFGYGYDYFGAVKAFYQITGAPSFLPAYAFGNWWSRYYNYTQDEYIETMDSFNREDIPLSVGIVDMDWHITEIPDDKKNPSPKYAGYWNTENGWTGYSFNKKYFPNHIRFLEQLKERNIHTAFNLHPHAGIRCHEDMYEEMAIASGIDPKTRETVPFNVLSKKFMANYFDILHHPYEKEGVDFWWMDWQQGKDYWWIHEPNKNGNMEDERETVDPLWMINHLHTMDISRDGKRPMFFSRYSGPGGHRYSIGFSGDTFITWASLDFQPYFTATASNIGYCWWSHDIGGHMHGYKDEELTARWIQLGVFSPINRLHSSNDRFLHKEPWLLKGEYKTSVGKWLRFRHSLFPYVYTMNYAAANALVPLIRPIYYYYPKNSAAYEMKNQFFFGSEIMIAPITKPASEITGLGDTCAYLPKGDWFDFLTGDRYHSEKGRKIRLYRDIGSYPIIAKAGAIIPIAPHIPHTNKLGITDSLEVYVFPGNDNVFELYEDSGDGESLKNGEYALTRMKLCWNEFPEFQIGRSEGNISLLPKKRLWNIKLRGFSETAEFKTELNGITIDTPLKYDGDKNTFEITVTASPQDRVTVKLKDNKCITSNPNVLKRCDKILQESKISADEKNEMYEILTDSECDTHMKILKLSGRSYEKEALAGALKEQLTLTKEEFTV